MVRGMAVFRIQNTRRNPICFSVWLRGRRLLPTLRLAGDEGTGRASFDFYCWPNSGVMGAVVLVAHVACTCRPCLRSGEGNGPSEKPVNWLPWKQMDHYTIRDFAAILSKEDPVSIGSSHEKQAWFNLLIDEARRGKLPHIPEAVGGWGASGIQRQIGGETKIRKPDAIKWADADEGRDVSHVR